jgi:hypothetical protein
MRCRPWHASPFHPRPHAPLCPHSYLLFPPKHSRSQARISHPVRVHRCLLAARSHPASPPPAFPPPSISLASPTHGRIPQRFAPPLLSRSGAQLAARSQPPPYLHLSLPLQSRSHLLLTLPPLVFSTSGAQLAPRSPSHSQGAGAPFPPPFWPPLTRPALAVKFRPVLLGSGSAYSPRLHVYDGCALASPAMPSPYVICCRLPYAPYSKTSLNERGCSSGLPRSHFASPAFGIITRARMSPPSPSPSSRGIPSRRATSYLPPPP